MTPAEYRKRPVVVEAMQWLGGDTTALTSFVGQENWTRADAWDMGWDHDDSEEVVLWNEPERAWIPLPVGHWVVRGVVGEFHPCAPEIFEQTCEPLVPETITGWLYCSCPRQGNRQMASFGRRVTAARECPVHGEEES